MDKNRAIFVAIANATYGLITNTIHCRDEGPDLCDRKIGKIAGRLASSLPCECKLLMIGFQPVIAYNLSRIFGNFRVTDMDPANIWGVRSAYGINRSNGTTAYVLRKRRPIYGLVTFWPVLVFVSASIHGATIKILHELLPTRVMAAYVQTAILILFITLSLVTLIDAVRAYIRSLRAQIRSNRAC
ncbi:MAG: hypothetical protein QXR84_04460 [Candidatus Bathyarchaeia archaeon]|nr:hypothetical protein [Candidatus Bathyarchaeota archaeon]